MDRLKGKVAIVTGSTSGIGTGIAKLFAAEGAKVVICGRREAKGQVVVDAIKAEGGEASYHFMDIMQVESIEALIKDTVEKYGKVDILVNNAANVGLKDGRVDELTLDMWDAVFSSDTLRSKKMDSDGEKFSLSFFKKGIEGEKRTLLDLVKESEK